MKRRQDAFLGGGEKKKKKQKPSSARLSLQDTFWHTVKRKEGIRSLAVISSHLTRCLEWVLEAEQRLVMVVSRDAVGGKPAAVGGPKV